MTTSTVEDYRPVIQCAVDAVDPEWWVHEHPGQCAKGCAHGLAAHICLTHCAFLDLCQDQMAQAAPSEYNGMVLGGLMRVHTHHGRVTRVPKVLYESCELCTIRR